MTKKLRIHLLSKRGMYSVNDYNRHNIFLSTNNHRPNFIVPSHDFNEFAGGINYTNKETEGDFLSIVSPKRFKIRILEEQKEIKIETFETVSSSLRKLNYYILNKDLNKKEVEKKIFKFNPNYKGIKSEKDGFELSTLLLQGDITGSFNIDDIVIDKNKDITLLELLKCEDKQKITAHQSHPNRYVLSNINKFKSIYRLAKDLSATVAFLNYDNKGNVKLLIENRKQEIDRTFNDLDKLNYNIKKKNHNIFKFIYDTKNNLNINNIKEYLNQNILKINNNNNNNNTKKKYKINN